MSIYGIISQGVPSIGTLAMGTIAAHWGLRFPIAAGAALCIVLWAWGWRLRIPLAARSSVERSLPRRIRLANSRSPSFPAQLEASRPCF